MFASHCSWISVRHALSGLAVVLLVGLAPGAAEAAEFGYERAWGYAGEIDDPVALDTDAAGNVYVTGEDDKVRRFSATGRLLTTWGGTGEQPGQLLNPTALAVDPQGNVHIADLGRALVPSRVQVFSPNGTLLRAWGLPGALQWAPTDLDFDGQGNAYVVDAVAAVVHRFDAAQRYTGAIGGPGTGDGQFDAPSGIAVDRQGVVFVADRDNHRVQKFDARGAFVTKWGQNGLSDGQFIRPHGITLGPGGDVFVIDEFSDRVQRFSSGGAFRGLVGKGRFRDTGLRGITAGADGTLYVAAYLASLQRGVAKFRPVTVTVASKSLRARGGSVRVRVACANDERCRGRLHVVHKGATLARASYRVAAGSRRTVAARLTAKGRRVLRRKAKVAVTVRLAPVGGPKVSARATLRR